MLDKDDVVKENDYLMLCTEGETRVVKACKKGMLKVAKRVKFPSKSLIGVKYNSVLELKGKDVVAVDRLVPDLSRWLGEDYEVATGTDNDNRDLVDQHSNQGLSYEDIEKLKKNGATATDLIDALTKNSSTWNSKTVFSKTKYLKRKLKKFMHRFRVERTCPENIMQNEYSRDKRKICSLRWDSMAKILSYVNLTHNTNALVYDMTKGLVTSSMAYRMQGTGRVFSIHKGGKRNNLETQFNFHSKIKESIRHISLHKIENLKKKKKNGEPINSDEEQLLRGMDSLAIIVDGHKDDPWDLLKTLLPFVKPSSPIIVFTPYIEPLTNCYQKMLQNYKGRIAIDVKLTDSFTREIQILSMRTYCFFSRCVKHTTQSVNPYIRYTSSNVNGCFVWIPTNRNTCL